MTSACTSKSTQDHKLIHHLWTRNLCVRDNWWIHVRSNDAAGSIVRICREVAARYAMGNQQLFMELMGAALEALGIPCHRSQGLLRELEAGYSQIMLNCYPACPQPDLTLGLPPHSDYCLFTLLLQDQVKGLQVLRRGHWFTVDAAPGSIIANVGDHLEV